MLKKKTITKDGCPFTCPRYGGKVEYYEGMCPKTDDLLARSVTLNYNLLLHIDDEGIDEVARNIREVCNELQGRDRGKHA